MPEPRADDGDVAFVSVCSGDVLLIDGEPCVVDGYAMYSKKDGRKVWPKEEMNLT